MRFLSLRKDRNRNDDICHITGVACVMDKVSETRLRWYGHVQQWEDDDCAKRILETDVYGQRSWGRQWKRWINIVKYDLEKLRLTAMDAEDHAEWGRRNPSPEEFTAWRRERQTDRQTQKETEMTFLQPDQASKHETDSITQYKWHNRPGDNRRDKEKYKMYVIMSKLHGQQIRSNLKYTTSK